MGMHKGLIGKSEGGGSAGDKTLADYLRRKNRQEAFNHVNEEKKQSFQEWYQQYLIDFDGKHPSADVVWYSAQRNV